MDTFTGFTEDDLSTDMSSFYAEYALAHPDIISDLCSALYGKLVGILIDCEVIVYGYEAGERIGYTDSLFESRKLAWLFYNMNLTGLASQFQSFIIKVNDSSLSDKDYILLFYISLQSQEVQNTAQEIPLSMLHDMFLPVADNNLREWKLVS
jgi:hypothetical protein